MTDGTIIWKMHIWTDAIGNLEMKSRKHTQDVCEEIWPLGKTPGGT